MYIVGYTFAVVVEILALRKTLLVSMGENWFTSNGPIFQCGSSWHLCGNLNMLSL